MKIYKVHMVLTLVMARLKKYTLEDYNSSTPIIFVEAKDPDDACYKAMHKLASKILKTDHSIETLNFVKDIFHDIRIIKIEVP
tara:strand:- start:17486 stop:17734 length:249 start_codon:yes stop_codon:yes gene_type:complete